MAPTPSRGEHGSAVPAPDVAPDLRHAIEAELRRAHVPGGTVAMVRAEGVAWIAGFGIADLRTNRPATPETIYRLFSGTKLFTATAVLQLVEAGRVSLDDPIGRHVPAAAHLGDVTVRHLLSHTSGLKDPLRAFIAATISPDPLPSAEEALRTYPIVAARAPGSTVAYGNVNYALLGALISRVSGVEYRDYLRQRVLAPVGAAADFTLTEAMRPSVATGYLDWWDPMRVLLRLLHPMVSRRLYLARAGRHVALADYGPSTSAIGGLVGPVAAFGAFLSAHLADDGRLLRSETLHLMRRMVARGAAGIESRVGTGLGWKIGNAGGVPFLNHEGGGPGFTSEMRLYPERGIGVVLAMNTMRMPATMRVAHRIAELIRTRSDRA